ncbi:hypothetical protein Pcinc_037480 [Petrolisthes cinctipes]|uniref:Uncharacterized protein n=1 Tax=Petrolisthes cinctipes TaxID=88211 RepID=A0AAE1ENX8_PETCI|nr:hypothetical protein Pcinc_037480 [Petrolisthes cinctipes]
MKKGEESCLEELSELRITRRITTARRDQGHLCYFFTAFTTTTCERAVAVITSKFYTFRRYVTLDTPTTLNDSAVPGGLCVMPLGPLTPPAPPSAQLVVMKFGARRVAGVSDRPPQLNGWTVTVLGCVMTNGQPTAFQHIRAPSLTHATLLISSHNIIKPK